MSVLGDTVTIGGGGAYASIWVTGDVQSTDSVTATKGSKTINGVYTAIPNPAYHNLPSGYTELEYIQSSGTQYIDTLFKPNQNSRIKLDFQGAGLSSWSNIVGTYGGTSGTNKFMFLGCLTDTNEGYTYIGSKQLTPITISWTDRIVADLDAKNGTAKIGAITYNYGQIGSFQSEYNAIISGVTGYSGTVSKSKIKVFSCMIYDDGILLNNFIPCTRTSDSAIGLYDLVSQTFFGNAGTGAFIAGNVVPSTLPCFVCDKIDEFGTWTVTASRSGTVYYTENVLVDAAEEFEVTVSYRLYLYNEGDQCTSITGGWTSSGYYISSWGATVTLRTPTKTENSITMSCTGNDACFIGTANKILSSVLISCTKAVFEYTVNSFSIDTYEPYAHQYISFDKDVNISREASGTNQITSIGNKHDEVMLSTVTRDNYVCFGLNCIAASGRRANLSIKKIWLE